MFYQRKIYPELLKHASTNTNTVLTGMRRTGKTTLVRQLLQDLKNQNSLFLDLERVDNREIFLQKNYDTIRDSFIARGLNADLPMIVALDEIQYVQTIPSVIKYLTDHYQMKFIVTGSSSFYLKNVFSESLTGRKKIFELFPLDFAEYLLFRQISHVNIVWQDSQINQAEHSRLTNYYNDFIRYGGFPQVVLADLSTEKADILADIISSYVNVDIKTLADFTDERNIYNLIRLLASRVGSRIDVSKLSQITSLSRQTVNNYLDFLEKTYLISLVPVHTNSPDREIVKANKVYFTDTGLANHLATLSSGAQFENTLYNQLSRQGKVQYYALKTGQEIDFVFSGDTALESKETPTPSDLPQLQQLSSLAGLKNGRLVGRHFNAKFTNFIWGGDIRSQ